MYSYWKPCRKSRTERTTVDGLSAHTLQWSGRYNPAILPDGRVQIPEARSTCDMKLVSQSFQVRRNVGDGLGRCPRRGECVGETCLRMQCFPINEVIRP